MSGAAAGVSIGINVSPTPTNHGQQQSPEKALSPSKITTWLDCQARFFFSDVVGLKEPPSEKLALHRAITSTITAAICVPLDERADMAEDARTYALGQLRKELEPVEDRNEATETLQAQALLMTDAILPFVAQLQPGHVRHTLTGEIAGVPLHGVVDFEGLGGELIQFSVKPKRPSTLPGDKRRQLAIYATLAQSHTAKLCTITNTKTPQVVVKELDNVRDERAHLEQLLPVIQQQIGARLYTPNRGSMLCSKRNCAFARECEHEFGGHVAD